MISPSRKYVRKFSCPRCGASAGHPCTEDRKGGHAGKHFGHVREANHAERIAAANWQRGVNDK